ncbi:hypothetical protein [Bacillus massilinigeriensis]|uniref:hypothetical protein n=1 Tax=Bacillus mediterraneensis TaxID=1805474 RepID=UPI0008F968F5|nr:hypothetical protein [Bacillus mediterraneensis]
MESKKTVLGAAAAGSLLYLLRNKASREQLTNSLQVAVKSDGVLEPNWSGYTSRAEVPKQQKNPVTGLPYKGIPEGTRVCLGSKGKIACMIAFGSLAMLLFPKKAASEIRQEWTR